MNRPDEEDEQQQNNNNNNLAEDDNAQIEDVDDGAGAEDPLLLAIDDLEGRVVAALDEVKLHPGVASGTSSIHEEMAQLLRPVLEVAAHTGPSVARTYFREGVDEAVENVYERLVSDLVLPVLLEMAQSDPTAAKRGAALEFFRAFWKEAHKAGSWLDATTPPNSAACGPYGSGGGGSGASSSSSSAAAASQGAGGGAVSRPLQLRRREKRLTREGEVLRYWLQAAIASFGATTATNNEQEATVARGVLAASAAVRPALKHIVQRIKAADDRGANRLYAPVMKLTEAVLQKLLLSSSSSSSSDAAAAAPDQLTASCIKFVEIVVLCCSRKPQDPATQRRKASATPQDDFSLEDLPEGHPVITRESLESIAEYAFTVLRGFSLLGGQVKIDANVLSGMMMSGGGSPSEQVVNILKPAALAYLELESNFPQLFAENEDDNKENSGGKRVNLETNLDRSSLEYDFRLGAKAYSVVLNAVAALATHRPTFFQDASICLGRRAVLPDTDDKLLSAVAVKALACQIKSSCLTLLRNALSISTNSHAVLQKALQHFDMQAQADKAVAMAKQAHSLKTANRATRNRANIYYEWESTTTSSTTDSDSRLSKRQRETDDALAQLRAAKAARGLGHGIQLPSSMSDAVDLVMANLEHLPTARPPTAAASSSGPRMTLEWLVDAILTNGASLLSREEGRWYERDGASAWEVNLEHDDENSNPRFRPSAALLQVMELVKRDDPGDPDTVQKRRQLYTAQAHQAAADAEGRILTVVHDRNSELAAFGRSVAARLALTLRHVAAPANSTAASAVTMAQSSIAKGVSDADHARKLQDFVDLYPLATAGLALDATAPLPDHAATQQPQTSVAVQFLTEALLQQDAAPEDPYCHNLFDLALDVHVAASVHASTVANDKPHDATKKKLATQAVAALQRDLVQLPRLTPSSILQLAALCDMEALALKAKKDAASEPLQTAKTAAEKRATAALVLLRDVAFGRGRHELRTAAVECAVGLATGRFPSTADLQGKALKLVMNLLFARSDALAQAVVDAATYELELAAKEAVSLHEEIEKANAEAAAASNKTEAAAALKKNPLAPGSEVEKQAMDRLRKPAVLFLALCVRRTDIIGTLFQCCSRPGADVLSKTVRAHMPRLAAAAATKHGAASIAFDVASMAGTKELPLLLSFLENLSNAPDQDLIDACFKIQDSKTGADGQKDARYILPVLKGMKRSELVALLPDFVMAEDDIFLDALQRMGKRVSRQALLFRDELEPPSSLQGLTLCEQLVFLHKLDFAAAKIPQKRYLSAIKLCLEDVETYHDRVLMSALDQISGVFLTGGAEEKLPLAFMRTVILVCTRHESLHSWISQVLLTRLIEGKIYQDARQWEGWMRATHMLEQSGDAGVHAHAAIQKLPPEQLLQYQSKWAGKTATAAANVRI